MRTRAFLIAFHLAVLTYPDLSFSQDREHDPAALMSSVRNSAMTIRPIVNGRSGGDQTTLKYTEYLQRDVALLNKIMPENEWPTDFKDLVSGALLQIERNGRILAAQPSKQEHEADDRFDYAMLIGRNGIKALHSGTGGDVVQDKTIPVEERRFREAKSYALLFMDNVGYALEKDPKIVDRRRAEYDEITTALVDPVEKIAEQQERNKKDAAAAVAKATSDAWAKEVAWARDNGFSGATRGVEAAVSALRNSQYSPDELKRIAVLPALADSRFRVTNIVGDFAIFTRAGGPLMQFALIRENGETYIDGMTLSVRALAFTGTKIFSGTFGDRELPVFKRVL